MDYRANISFRKHVFMTTYSQRGAVGSFIVMDMMAQANALARDGIAVKRLEAGAPDSAPPPHIMAELGAHLAHHSIGYTDSAGTQELRHAIAQLYQQRYHHEVDARTIMVTCGSSAALTLALLVSFEAGDAIALPLPTYPAYRHMAHALNLKVVDMPLAPSDNYALTPDLIKKLPSQVKGIILNNPANPTGVLLDKQALTDIAHLCQEREMRLISDEIYHDITFGQSACSLHGIDPNAIIVGGFSKFFALAGWRLGWMIAPSALMPNLLSLQQNLYVAPSGAGQWLATRMLASDALKAMHHHVARWNDNRRALLKMIENSRLEIAGQPQGGFYIYCDAAAITDDSQQWCQDMLTHHHIALAPGEDFDPIHGHQFIRFSFCRPQEEIKEAIDILTPLLS